MKIRPLVATVGATLLVILVTAPMSFGFVPHPSHETQVTPLGAVAGGAPFAAVLEYQPVGKPTRAGGLRCSTGVPWRLANGTRGFLTAGHCLPASQFGKAQIFQSVSTSGWIPGAPLGSRTARMTTTNASGTIPGKVGDIAFVPSRLPVHNDLFTGGPESRSLTPITSWTSKATSNYSLCFSGSHSGSRCGLKQGTVTSYRPEGKEYTGIAEAYFSPGIFAESCVQSGDSGGAVYRMSPDGRSAYVVGIISGFREKRLTSLGCSTYYTPLGAAQKQFGGGPIIS